MYLSGLLGTACMLRIAFRIFLFFFSFSRCDEVARVSWLPLGVLTNSFPQFPRFVFVSKSFSSWFYTYFSRFLFYGFSRSSKGCGS